MKAGTKLGLDIASIIESLRLGTHIAKIAKLHGCHISTIIEIRNEAGIPLRFPRLTQQQINEVVRRLKAGELHREIADAVGAKIATVARIATKVGLRRLCDISKLPMHAMVVAHGLGKSCREIADEVRCSVDTVRKLLKRRGIDLAGWGLKATDQQIRACQFAGMSAAAAARKFGCRPSGDWYQRWHRIAAERSAKQVSA